jgi:hypothetical protein
MVSTSANSLYSAYYSREYARWLTVVGVVPLAVGAALLPFVRRQTAA